MFASRSPIQSDMARFLHLLCLLLCATAACSHAALPPQAIYWRSVLPNTPMPRAISDLLSPETIGDEKSTSVTVGKGGVNVGAGKGKPGGTTVSVGNGGVHVSVGQGKPGGTNVNVHPGGVGVNVGPKHGKPPVIVNVSPFLYRYAATETQLHDDPNVALFFLEKDLHPGTKMTLQWGKDGSGAAFLPRSTADSIPFSSSKLPEILAHFSIPPNSVEAAAMKQTLLECEQPAVKNEKKYCATSLESMVDFSVASLGTTNLRASSTTVGKTDLLRQQYTIGSVGRMAEGKLVACHAEEYPYAVFYCHMTQSARGYAVKMDGKDGTAVQAVAVCHTDTAAWNPKHVAFRVLKVKPGTVPVCHFLPQDHIVWSRRG